MYILYIFILMHLSLTYESIFLYFIQLSGCDEVIVANGISATRREGLCFPVYTEKQIL